MRPRRQSWRISREAILAIGLMWLVVGAVVFWGAVELRRQMRLQILNRDGNVLAALARVRGGEVGRETGREGALEEDAKDETGSLFEEDPLASFMELAKREGIVAAWYFEADGTFVTSLPAAARDGQIPAAAMEVLRAGSPYSFFDPAIRLSDVFLLPELVSRDSAKATIPAVEVYVPVSVRNGKEVGAIAGFLIEAGSLVEQFQDLDRQLWRQGIAVMSVAAVVTGITLFVLFRRLEQAHGLVRRRTGDLQRANRELAQSARTAALGAVTAHLVHGLKNPMSGLHTFVATRAGDSASDDALWREAEAATRRMQKLIQDVVRVIREQETEVEYEIPLTELGEAVLSRCRPMADRRGIRLLLENASDGDVDNRRSGILALILGNLVENAIEATRDGGEVRLHLDGGSLSTRCDVIDQGQGIPVESRARLFQPQASTKEGGSGLGLAITRQLALALGGEVQLVASDSHGSTFRVEVPNGVASEPDPSVERSDSAPWKPVQA